jgi:hypothetical protein
VAIPVAILWQFCGNSARKVVESGILVAKNVGNSGKKWQEIEALCGELWQSREIPGRNFKLQRDHQKTKMTLRPLGAQVVVIFCGISNCRLVEIFDLNSFTQFSWSCVP